MSSVGPSSSQQTVVIGVARSGEVLEREVEPGTLFPSSSAKSSVGLTPPSSTSARTFSGKSSAYVAPRRVP